MMASQEPQSEEQMQATIARAEIEHQIEEDKQLAEVINLEEEETSKKLEADKKAAAAAPLICTSNLGDRAVRVACKLPCAPIRNFHESVLIR